MSVALALPLFVAFTAMYLFAASPLLKAADAPPANSQQRIRTLDGLRGFLASAVFLHHAALYHSLLNDGVWDIQTSPFLFKLGAFAVALFFMITGYLFWGKVLKEKGRPDWIRLYVGRVFRIGPLYLVAAGWLLLCVLIVTRFKLRVPASQAVREITSWLVPLGITRGDTSVNGYDQAWRFLAGVTWTIHFEWIFYCSLVALALFPRFNRKAGALLPATLLVLCLARVVQKPQYLWLPSPAVMVTYFSGGMLTASILRSRTAALGKGALFSCVALLLGCAYFLFPIRTAWDH